MNAQRTLFLFATVLPFNPALFAGEALPTYELSPFVTVAPRVPGHIEEVPPELMRSAKPVDLAEILSSQLPAAALSRKSPLAGDIVLRGFSRDNVLITVDDNKTFCACPNRMDPPAFHVSSQQIVGVSVRTGPFSVDQGASLGGSVAVRTSAPSAESFARLYGYAGSFGYWAAGGTGSLALAGQLTGLGGIYYQSGDVYEDGSGTRFTELPGLNYTGASLDGKAFTVLTAEAKALYSLDEDTSLTISYAIQDASDVLYPGLRMDAPSDTLNRASITCKSSVDLAYAEKIELAFAFSHVDHDMTDSFRTSLNNMGGQFAARGYFMRTQAMSAYAGMRFELEKPMDQQSHLRYGLNLSRRFWDADNVVGPNANDMLPDVINDTAGAWLVYEKRTGPWAVELGGRLDIGRSKAREDITFVQDLQSSGSNSQWDMLPSVYGLVSRETGNGLKAYAGLGFASRLPDPQERYINLDRPGMNADWIGNPDLDPTENLEAQGGLQWTAEVFSARLSVFHAWLFDYIYLTRLAGERKATTYQNIDARIYGVSGDFGWNVVEFLRLEAGFAWQEGTKETLPSVSSNDVLAEIPPLRARFAAIFSRDAFSFRAQIQLQEDLDRIDPDLNEVGLDGFAVMNLSSGYQVTENLTVSLGVDNVLDETFSVANAFVRDPFRTGVVVNEPGRFWYFRIAREF